MSIPELVSSAFLLAGLSGFIYGLVFSNIAVYEMAKIWNQSHSDEERIPPFAALGRGANTYEVIPKYRKMTSDGPLYKQLRNAYRALGAGVALAVIGFGFGYLTVGHGH